MLILHRARVIFLHVITYNKAAVHLYNQCKYCCVANLEDFYSIRSGRQPDPNRIQWDAFLFSKFVPMEIGGHEAAPHPDSITTFKTAWDTCWPFSCRYGFWSPVWLMQYCTIHGWKLTSRHQLVHARSKN